MTCFTARGLMALLILRAATFAFAGSVPRERSGNPAATIARKESNISPRGFPALNIARTNGGVIEAQTASGGPQGIDRDHPVTKRVAVVVHSRGVGTKVRSESAQEPEAAAPAGDGDGDGDGYGDGDGEGEEADTLAGEPVEMTGWVVDNFCWDRPGHVALDGANLGTNPQDHTLHCLWEIKRCRDSGYVMLEKLDAPAEDGTMYGKKYQLDAAGDNLVILMGQRAQDRDGGSAKVPMLKINGSLLGGELAVSSVCEAGTTTCYDESQASSVVIPNGAPQFGFGSMLLIWAFWAATASL